jgi:predicted acylesterase/phospholipase RssA
VADAYTREFRRVQRAELERISQHRRHRGDDSPELYGLALSGGGIRSASFALGVLQALDRHDLLRRIDYLSTVSGGGYIGSSLSWFMRGGRKTFPFGTRGLGVRSDAEAEAGGREEPAPNAILSFVRQHGHYLSPRTAYRFDAQDGDGDADRGKTAGVGTGSLVAVLLRNMLLCLLVYGSLLVALFAGLRWPGPWIAKRFEELGVDLLSTLPPATTTTLSIAALLLGLFLVLSVPYPLVTLPLHWGHAVPTKDNRFARYTYRLRLWSQSLTGRLLFWLGVLLVLASVPWVAGELAEWLPEQGWWGALSTIAGAVIGFLRFRSDLAGGGSGAKGGLAKALRAAAPPAAALLLVYGLLLLAHHTADALPGAWALVPLIPGVVIGLAFGINYIGVNRLYRDRLMETFLPGDDAVAANEWRPAREADVARLHEMCGPDTGGPYHLVNANLVSVDSSKSKYRGRGGDSFLLSSLYCGSDATGWRSTGDWMHGGLSLAAAMAISGAAANPNTGVSGRGATRNRLLSLVMALLNLRLGYFAQNPNPDRAPRLASFPANLLYPGLVQGLFGRNLSETRPFVELSDGGHFENLGLYELVRRRCDVIIVSDAGADPELSFSDLAYAAERIRVDFGVNLRMSKDYGLDGMLEGSAGDDPMAEKYRLSERGYFLATIDYPDGRSPGILVYLKSTMIREVPADVLGYKDRNPDFPDQPTADQFFDEEQFEAYRELGYRIGRQAFTEIQRAAPSHAERVEIFLGRIG